MGALEAAAMLCLLGAVWHGVGGEIGIVRMLDPDVLAPSFFGDGDITKRFLRACWHLFTVNLVVTAAALAWVARTPSAATPVVAWMVAIEHAAFLLVYVAVAVPRPRVFVRAPQWLFFAAVAVLAWRGA
jgi:FtsH-binding integral membrane protein